MSSNPGHGGRGGWQGSRGGRRGGFQDDRNREDFQPGGSYPQGANFVEARIKRLDLRDDVDNSGPYQPQQQQYQQYSQHGQKPQQEPQQPQQQYQQRGGFGGRPAQSRGRGFQQRYQAAEHSFERLYRDGASGRRTRRAAADPSEKSYSLHGRESVSEAQNHVSHQGNSHSFNPDTPVFEPQNPIPAPTTLSGFSVQLHGSASRLQGRLERMSQEEAALQEQSSSQEKPQEEEERPRYRGGFGQRNIPSQYNSLPDENQGQFSRQEHSRYGRQDREQGASSLRGGFANRGPSSDQYTPRPDRIQDRLSRDGQAEEQGRLGRQPAEQGSSRGGFGNRGPSSDQYNPRPDRIQDRLSRDGQAEEQGRFGRQPGEQGSSRGNFGNRGGNQSRGNNSLRPAPRGRESKPIDEKVYNRPSFVKNKPAVPAPTQNPEFHKPYWMQKVEAQRIVTAERIKEKEKDKRKNVKIVPAHVPREIYENGVNSNRRSDYELDKKIPTFSQEEMDKDGKTCETLHKLITKNKLTVEKLHEMYHEDVRKQEEEPVLKTLEEVRNFLESHGHVFYQNFANPQLRNRGFGYRRCIVYICCIILSRESGGQGVSINDIFEEIADLPSYSFDYPWDDEWIWERALTPDALIDFFSDHPEIFYLDEKEGTVKITDSAKKIPTLWDSTILALPSTVSSSKNIYWDISRSQTFVGYVFATSTEYCSVRITHGVFKKRNIYCLASDMGMSFKKFALLNPTGAMVTVTGHITLGAKNEFRALHINPIRFDTGEAVATELAVNETTEDKLLVGSREEMELVEKVHERSMEEKEILTVLDKLVEEKKVSWTDLEKSWRNMQNDGNFPIMSILSSVDSLKVALQERPHLYKAETIGVTSHSQEEQAFKLKLLHHLCKVTSEQDKKFTVEQLTSSFSDSEDLQELGDAEKLEVAIKKLKGLVEMKADADGDPWTIVCFIDGVYYTKHNVFLPKFDPFA